MHRGFKSLTIRHNDPMMRSSHRRLLLIAIVALVAAGAVIVLLQNREPALDADDRALVGEIEALGLPAVFAPTFDDVPIDEVRVEAGGLWVSYNNGAGTAWTLDQAVAPDATGCGLRPDLSEDEGWSCQEEEGYVVWSFEEMSTVGVTRDGMLLTVAGVVTEADAEIAGEVAKELSSTSEVTATELVAAAKD